MRIVTRPESIDPGRLATRVEEPARTALGSTDERLDALAATYDTTVDMTWVVGLAAKYGLEVTL